MVEKVGEKLGSAGAGVLAGMGTDYVWSALKLPGYGQIAFTIGKRQDGENLDMGYDDLIEIAIGGATVGYGYYKKRGNVVAGGVGFIGGVLLTKLFEAFGAGITPITPPPEAVYVAVEKVEEPKEPSIFYSPLPPMVNGTLGRYVAQ